MLLLLLLLLKFHHYHHYHMNESTIAAAVPDTADLVVNVAANADASFTKVAA